MGIPANAGHVVVRGHLAGGESFAFGQWFQVLTPMSQAVLDNLLATYVQAHNSQLKPSLQAAIGADCGVDQIIAYGYDGAAHASFTSVSATSYVGTNANKVLPLQTCLVVSLRTGRPGRSFRGRVYLPYLSKALATYQAQPADVDVIANGYAGMLSTVNDATGSGGFNRAIPVVMSSKVSALTPITSVVVDSKTDVQRRRARSESIVYTKTTALT